MTHLLGQGKPEDFTLRACVARCVGRGLTIYVSFVVCYFAGMALVRGMGLA